MGYIINKKSGRMKIETYLSIQTVKYVMMAKVNSATNRSVKYFQMGKKTNQ